MLLHEPRCDTHLRQFSKNPSDEAQPLNSIVAIVMRHTERASYVTSLTELQTHESEDAMLTRTLINGDD